MLKWLYADKFVSLSGIHTQEEMDYYDHIYSSWKQSQRQSKHVPYWLNIFPEAKEYVTLQLEEKQTLLNTLYDRKRSYENFITNPNNCSYVNQWFWRLVADAIFIPEINEKFGKYARMDWWKKADTIDSLEKEIKAISFALTPRKDSTETSINEHDVARAKSIPIDTFLDFNRAGFTHCINHEERTGSLKYYPEQNRVTCFGCGFKEDSIGVIMKLHNLNFIDAVRFLIKK